MSSLSCLSLLLAVALLGVAATTASAREVTLAEKGQARCVIVVPTDWEAAVTAPADLPAQALRVLEGRRQLQRDSVKDLALYLGKMSGTAVEIVTALPAGDKRVPIYVGGAAAPVFGPVGISKSGLFGFRVVVDARRGVGLYGESEVAASYAIYELLHRLGCRWFMPSELGEVVPDLPTLTVPEMDLKLAPATNSREMTQGGAEFHRRNRIGRYDNTVWLAYGDGSFERFFSKADLDAHPDWHAIKADGTPHPWALRQTHPGVADFVAEKIIAQLDTVYEPMKKAGLRPGYSLTPNDGQVPTEDPFERPHDADPRVWEPAAGRWSVTDRCMVLHNRIAEKVRAKYPDVAFGDQAYVNKSLPPVKNPVPADFRIVICPIDFNRNHPVDWPNHPNEYWLRDLVQGWNKAGAKIGAYWYGINLAEISAPCPFITKWGTDVKFLLDNNLQEWMPETMNGWDSMMPGYYLAIRMTFNAQEKPDDILNDMWTRFYGAAAEPMRRYWTGIDKAYLDTPEYAGSPYTYLKIFSPVVMAAARKDINDALAACKTPVEYRRVKLIDESFGLFELYMQMRVNWAAGNLRGLDEDYETWRWGVRNMQRLYHVPVSGNRYTATAYTGDGFIEGRHGNPAWSDSMYSPGYKDGARMERDYTRVGRAMLEWKWQYNPGSEADALPWTAPNFVDKDWKTTHVVRDTWSSLGHHFTLTDESAGRSGRMAYRTAQKLPAISAGKKVYLWIGATDGSAKVFVNGTQIKYVTDKGEVREAFSGYGKPATFDITAAVKTGDNQFTILCERTSLNELGTGGLMGPVVLYREK